MACTDDKVTWLSSNHWRTIKCDQWLPGAAIFKAETQTYDNGVKTNHRNFKGVTLVSMVWFLAHNQCKWFLIFIGNGRFVFNTPQGIHPSIWNRHSLWKKSTPQHYMSNIPIYYLELLHILGTCKILSDRLRFSDILSNYSC